MKTLKVRYNGKVLVPEGPVDLPTDCVLEVRVEDAQTAPSVKPSLAELAAALQALPENPNWPQDGAAQLDHYLYGSPKRP